MGVELKQLVKISRIYGADKNYIIAGGGNTSLKNKTELYIKASGISLGEIDENGFVVLDRLKLKPIMDEKYSEDPLKREEQIKNKLLNARLFPEKGQRPSVETSLHNMIGYKYVIHTHPYIINALLCSNAAAEKVNILFNKTHALGFDVLFIEYTDPGYTLAKKVKLKIESYQKLHSFDPKVIMLENHGIFVSSDDLNDLNDLYFEITKIIKQEFSKIPIRDFNKDSIKSENSSIIPEILKIYQNQSANTQKSMNLVGNIRNNELIKIFNSNAECFFQISIAVSPDIIVYCKSAPIYIEDTNNMQEILDKLPVQLGLFKKKWGYLPKVIILKDYGVCAIEENEKSVNIVLDMFEDFMKIAYYSQNFGGPKHLNSRELNFIDKWEVENYRRQIAKK
jgi:rhamnose utilization protein RhaD (predicted bifunctional aldolase and dehydrogenase)